MPFRGTNFTESNQSFRTAEGEMQIAAALWAHLHDQQRERTAGRKVPTSLISAAVPRGGSGSPEMTREDRSRASFDFACDIYESKFGKMPKRFEDLPTGQQGLWTMEAIVSDWYLEWAEHAFPRVQMSHSFASMLMATTISEKELPNVEAPWPSFMIEIPDKLLPVQAKGVDSCITRVCVNTHLMPTHMPDRWWTYWMQGPRIELHRAGALPDMVKPGRREKGELLHVGDVPRPEIEPRDAPITEEYDAFWDAYDDDQEERIVTLVNRLVVGVCVMMTERANYTERVLDLKKKLGEYAERFEKTPESRVYTLGKPVKVDFRQAVRAFVEGRTRGPMTVQRLVAGHHKRQPHGPNSSLRKWIFVEPYWSGPSDAPIVVRPHVG